MEVQLRGAAATLLWLRADKSGWRSIQEQIASIAELKFWLSDSGGNSSAPEMNNSKILTNSLAKFVYFALILQLTSACVLQVKLTRTDTRVQEPRVLSSAYACCRTVSSD